MRKLLKKTGLLVLAAMLALSLAASAALAENTEAPRSYFPYPAELETLPENTSLPDLFTFFDKSADPNGTGYVETPEEWDARADELRDLLQYYVYGSRIDPNKADTVITSITNNYDYSWADGVMTSTASRWGYSSLPVLPEGSFTYGQLDFSRFGMGIIYTGIAPNEAYVHAGDAFDMPGELADWKAGETWKDHAEVVSRVTLPTINVNVLIKDTNPEHVQYLSADAANGIPMTFTIRFPETAPTVDGVVRDEKASRNGTGYPILAGVGSVSEAQIVTLNNNGYVFIALSDTADPDNGQLSVYEKLYAPVDPVVYNDNTIVNDYMRDSGDLMHSGWAISRALDAIENYMLLSADEKAAINADVIIPNIDVYSSATIGCSHAGKRAIITGLFDTGDNGKTRFDIITASDAGGGGTTGFRYMTEGQLFSYEPPIQSGVVHNFAYGLNETIQRAIQNTSEDQWFGDRAQIFTVRPDLADNTPFDLHSLIATFATAKENRYFITWSCEGQDAWSNTPATVLDVWGAREAFEFTGNGGNIAVVVRDQAHATQDRDMADLIAIMDKEYYGADKLVRKYHKTLANATGYLAADGNGAIMPDVVFDSVADMERNPFFIPSVYLNWSRPTKHVLWTEADCVTQGVPMTFTFHTDAQKVELLLADGQTKLTADAKDGIATIAITSEQAQAGQYVATAIGEKDSKSIDICGWTVKDALRHSITDNSALGHDVGSGIAFTTPLINYNDPSDPVRLYMNGEALNYDAYDYDNKITLADGSVVPQDAYVQPYGASLLLYQDTVGYNVPMGDKVVYSIRNAKIAALQGYTIAMDVELEKYNPAAANAAPRMRWKTTYNTLSTQTPVWEPELLQNTPKSGLPKGEQYWPILGNWASDFDENGNLKDVSVIRPERSAETASAYNATITCTDADVNGFTVNFSEAVRKNDFALAINTVSGVSFDWAEDAKSVYVAFDAPATVGSTINAFVFRSVDTDGDMIGGPVAFDITVK